MEPPSLFQYLSKEPATEILDISTENSISSSVAQLTNLVANSDSILVNLIEDISWLKILIKFYNLLDSPSGEISWLVENRNAKPENVFAMLVNWRARGWITDLRI